MPDPTIVSVPYMVPTYVYVNLTTGEVDRVVVDDSAAAPVPHAVLSDEDDVTLDKDDAAKVMKIAENAEWPSWEFGW